MNVEITETKPVWVAWTNTDRTEGRGYEVPLLVAECPETAFRLGRGGGVQGGPCTVTESIAVRVRNQWLVPGVIHKESDEDKKLRAQREAREAVLAKAKSLGLTEQEIEALRR